MPPTAIDFDGITRWPEKARWDTVAGCENPDAAQSLAAAIVNARPAESAGMKDSAHFVEGVKIILRSLLHAAALILGGTMRDVVRWAQAFNDHEPSAILRDLSPKEAIWARELDQPSLWGDPLTGFLTTKRWTFGLRIHPVYAAAVSSWGMSFSR